MIEELYLCVFLGFLLWCNFEPGADLVIGHWLVCAECDEAIESNGILAYGVKNHFEDVANRTRAGVVGDYQKDFFVGAVVLFEEHLYSNTGNSEIKKNICGLLFYNNFKVK